MFLDREQIMTPLHFTGKLGGVDFEAEVKRGGPSAQAGAIRLALARALCSMVDRNTVEKMRLGKTFSCLFAFNANSHLQCIYLSPFSWLTHS